MNERDKPFSTHDIVALLFSAENRRLAKELISLNQRNKELRKIQVDGFVYNGHYYAPENAKMILGGKQAKLSLYFSLYEPMEEYLRDLRQCEMDRAAIRQMLVAMFHDCWSDQDVRDVLPECMLSLTPLGHLERVKEPAWTIKYNAPLMEQYQNLEPKMQYYSATRLFY